MLPPTRVSITSLCYTCKLNHNAQALRHQLPEPSNEWRMKEGVYVPVKYLVLSVPRTVPELNVNVKQALLVFVCVEVLRPSQSNGVMSSAVSLPNHAFTGQA